MAHSKYGRLDAFLEDIEARYLAFPQSNVEVRILSRLVLDMVNKIVEVARYSGAGWSWGRVIPVGSMAEGTRIGLPNEFDFMVVVDAYDCDDIKSVFSCKRGTFIELKSDCKRAAKAFRYRNNCYCTSKNLCKCNDFAYMDKGIIKSSNEAIWNALSVIQRDGLFFSMQSFPGRLRLVNSNTNIHGPAIQFNLLWETYGIGVMQNPMGISVDLVPVIEFEINAYFRHRLDVYHRKFYQELKDTDKIHVVPPNSNADDDTEGLFKVSFALTELKVIQNVSVTHKRCFMLLKYIFRTNESSSSFTSFVLKNLMFQHSVCCKNEGLGRCLMKMLQDLKDKTDAEGQEMPSIPHIFSTDVNLLQDDDDDEPHDYREERKEVSKLIKNLRKVRDGLSMSSPIQIE